MTKQRKEIVVKELYKALSYSDIFDYPLTGDQLFAYIGIKTTKKEFFFGLSLLPRKIVKNTIYYFLPKRQEIIAERVQKEKISLQKLTDAKRIGKFLGFFPTVQFVGISGSLALKNAGKKDDSDLFFITSPHTVWITRLWIYLMIVLLGRKRSRRQTGNAICANMFIDRNKMQFDFYKRNIYVAHEIVQLLPIVNKKNTYEKFLGSNKWVETYFPNTTLPKVRKGQNQFPISKLLLPLEYVMRSIQLWYMQKKTNS